jgi:hypothetical protein
MPIFLKKILLSSILFSAFKVNSQVYTRLFFGPKVDSYKNVNLKFNEANILGLAHSFYSELPKINFEEPVYKPDKIFTYKTDIVFLKGREFTVLDVLPFTTSKITGDKSVFKLKDIHNNEIIYYVYNHQNEYEFPFKVSSYKSIDSIFSKYIIRKEDEFTGDISIYSPLTNDISIYKFIKAGSTNPEYFLNLKTEGLTLNYDGKGVIILFKDGTKWTKVDEKIKVNVINGEGWGYSAFIKLTKDDLALFSSREINKFKLYIYENNRPIDTDRFVYYTQALMKMNN